MIIGILGIHGSIEEHEHSLKKLGIESMRVRSKEDVNKVQGLIIPGGESTTMIKLLNRFDIKDQIIKNYNENKLAIYGTCAGAILLSKKIANYPDQDTLKIMDIETERNGYGRQIDSFETKEDVLGQKINLVFIRAPVIKSIGKEVEILKELNNVPIMIKQNNCLVTTFHPELTEDTFVHKYFSEMCEKLQN